MDILEKRKPLLITLAVLVGILAAAVVVTLLISGRGGTEFRGYRNAPYPYSWVERDNGTILLILETGDVSDGAWTLADSEGGVMDVTVGNTKDGRAEVILKPRAQGREIETYALTRGEERLATLELSVAVSGAEGKLSASVISHRERALQSTVRGGEETGHPFTLQGAEESLTVFVEETQVDDESGRAWLCESSDTLSVYLIDSVVSDQGITFNLGARAEGVSQVTVYSPREGITFVFDMEVREGQMLLVDSHVETAEDQSAGEESESSAPGA